MHSRSGHFLASILLTASWLSACGGGGDTSEPETESLSSSNLPTTLSPQVPGKVILKAPALSFTDTGVSVQDNITSTGLWFVANDALPWEFSLDNGTTWTLGVGGSFEVKGDGSKMIWVRSRDDAGNTSEIVVVACVLDTMAPQAPSLMPSFEGVTRTLALTGVEAGARWEYSLDEQRSWLEGAGTQLAVLGNALPRLWLRQMDVAGNISAAQSFDLDQPMTNAWHEASGIPLQPSVMAGGSLTMLIHGSVVRGDADYVRWDIPTGHNLVSARLVHYASEDLIAFYALQRAPVFDAGFDVTRMLVYGHMGPQDLTRNVLSAVPPELLTSGPMTLWFQQTGPLPTRYAIEVKLATMK
jgi:hypothetical protein